MLEMLPINLVWKDINKKLCLCVKSGEVLLIKVKYCGIYRSDFKMKEVKKK